MEHFERIIKIIDRCVRKPKRYLYSIIDVGGWFGFRSLKFFFKNLGCVFKNSGFLFIFSVFYLFVFVVFTCSNHRKTFQIFFLFYCIQLSSPTIFIVFNYFTPPPSPRAMLSKSVQFSTKDLFCFNRLVILQNFFLFTIYYNNYFSCLLMSMLSLILLFVWVSPPNTVICTFESVFPI